MIWPKIQIMLAGCSPKSPRLPPCPETSVMSFCSCLATPAFHRKRCPANLESLRRPRVVAAALSFSSSLQGVHQFIEVLIPEYFAQAAGTLQDAVIPLQSKPARTSYQAVPLVRQIGRGLVPDKALDIAVSWSDVPGHDR